jgi:hypothetical protein
LYLLYVDESGDPNGWENQKIFVLGAIAVHEGQVTTLTERLDKIQAKYFPSVSLPIAFHAVDVHGGRGRFDHVDKETRMKLMKEIYEFIASIGYPKLIALATCIDDTAITSAGETIDKTLDDLCSRFNIFLRRLYANGTPSKGLMIVDQAHEEQYRQLLHLFQAQGTKYGLLGHIVDIPYFAGRKDTRMLQLADFVAYAVFRYYERDDESFLRMILDKFDKKGASREADAFKHITNKDCRCLACKWRLPASSLYKTDKK